MLATYGEEGSYYGRSRFRWITLADELLDAGYTVRVLDNLAPQVHGTRARRPSYLAREVEFIRGDVRDCEAISRALEGIDSVFHFAAVVGVGQSMSQIANYTDNNSQGTAVLLESLSAQPIERLIVASSMSIYGGGPLSHSHGHRCRRSRAHGRTIPRA